MDEITFDQIEIGKRYRIGTIYRGYGYRLTRRYFAGEVVATRRDSVTGAPIVRLSVDPNRSPLILTNLWEITPLP